MTMCECGCGTQPRGSNRFVHGHNSRGALTPNDYRIEGEVAYILLRDRAGTVVGEAIVDVDDLPHTLPRRWYLDANGYARSGDGAGHSPCALHRWLLEPPDHLQVDHLNHNRLDDRRANLRVCDQSTNLQNRKGAARHSKTGVRNVTMHESGMYRVNVVWRGRQLSFGYYTTIEEAAAAAENARREVFQHQPLYFIRAEQALGRSLPPRSKVFQDRTGIVVCENFRYLQLLQIRQRALDACGHPDWARCRYCDQWGPRDDELYVDPHGQARHRECHARAERTARRRRK